MTSDQLLRQLEKKDYILPQDIMKNTTEDELIKDLEEIFKKYQSKIDSEKDFRRKYIELVNYVFVSNLQKDKDKQKKHLFNKSLITYLLSTPETA